MIHNKSADSEICFLSLARPADALCVLVSSILPQRVTFLHSVYDFIAALQQAPRNRLVVLIARPSMLAKPYIAAALCQYPNLRMIGWLGNNEKLADPAISQFTAQSMVMVADLEQLRRVIAAFQNTPSPAAISRNPGNLGYKAKIDPVACRLSDEELDALLGVG